MSRSKKIAVVVAASSLIAALALSIPLVASGSVSPRKHAAPGKPKHSHKKHKKKQRRRVVRSDGGRLAARLGPLAIETPKGAIRKGQTLTVEAGKPKKFSDPGAPSLVGGPYTLSTSQGEPAKPVKVAFRYDRAKLSAGDPLVVHGLAGFGWVPEKTSVKPAAASASALLESFSPIDVVDGITWAAGDITGNRTDLPSGCGKSPDWIDWLSPIYSRNDSLPACTGAESDGQTLYIHVANNRGYAQYLTISNATLDVRRSNWSDSLEGMIANQLAAHSSSNSPSSFVLAPGSHAVLAIDRPAEGFGTTAVSMLAAAKGSSAMAAMGWALLNKVREGIGNRVDLVNCVTGSIYNSLASNPGASSAVAQLRSCAGAAAARLKGTAKEVMGKISSAVLVVDLFYKLVDLQADEAIPPSIKFSIHGRNPTNPAIHVGGLSLGSLPPGERTVVQLTASGGVAPYGFQISHAASNTAKVPSWVQLGSDGKLTIDPPADAAGHVGFYVYATDASGQSSPFARDEVTFFVGAGDGTISWSGIEAPLPADGIDSKLYSTTCPTANSCIAVGSFRRNDFTQQALIETYSGGVWTPLEAPLPPNAEGIEASLSSVACSPDATTCVAVGFYHGTDFKSHGLIETLSNGTWTATEAPGSSSYSYLASVACSADECIAVGNAGDAEAFVETLSNGTWEGGAAPLPANADVSYQQVRSAACSVDTCVAVGVYTNTDSWHRGLVEVLSGDTLVPLEAPLPSDTDLEGELGEVACAPTGPCMASGGYIAQGGSGHVFFGSVSGESWTPVPSTTSLPPNATGANWWVTACTSASACLGVGEFALTGFANRGLIETLSGGTWTGIEAPAPPPAVSSDALLSGACPAAGRCVAVGRFYDGGDMLGLIETQANGEWLPTEAQLPANANADRFAELGDVACSSATCVAVGRYLRSDLNEAGLIETGVVQQPGPG